MHGVKCVPGKNGVLANEVVMTQQTENRKQRMQWFRFYSEALHDPKIVSLSDRQYRAWVNILSVASLHEGVLPCARDIACHLRMTEVDVRTLVDELVFHGLIDIQSDKTLIPHGWKNRQYQSDCSTDRVRKFRQEKKETQETDAKRFSSVSVTAPETETEADTETDNTPKAPKGAPVPVQEAYDLWNATALVCGLTQGKLTPARRKGIAARLRENDGLTGWKQMLAGIERSSFLTGGQPGRNGGQSFRADLDFVLKPAKFQKIIEGGYGNGRHAGATAKPKQPAYLSRY